MEHLPQVRPFSNSPEEFADLAELARAENHMMFEPTDVIWKNGLRLGLFKVESFPMVWAYFSKRSLARDSAIAINIMEQTLFRQGARAIVVPVRGDSPFHEHMEGLGYRKDNNITYFYKNV